MIADIVRFGWELLVIVSDLVMESPRLTSFTSKETLKGAVFPQMDRNSSLHIGNIQLRVSILRADTPQNHESIQYICLSSQ